MVYRSVRFSVLLIMIFQWAPPIQARAQQDPVRNLQKEIADSQRRLEEVREERARLQRDMSDLRNRARNVTSELRNVERQLSTSRSVLAEIEFQLDATSERVGTNTRNLVVSGERLTESQVVLNRRLRDIYKRGPLHTMGVLLQSQSFSDLLNRYRYLQSFAAYDRSLVDRVEALEGALVSQSDELRNNMAELGRLKQEQLGEVAELRSVENGHQRALRDFRLREVRATSRLDQLEEDESRVTSLLTALERRRLGAERRRVIAGRGGDGPATLTTGDAGVLPWPVEGDLVYRFGRDRRPNGTVLRWSGIGIAAVSGTPVKAVRAGRVVLAGPFEGYGPTVVLSHGDGFYTLYLYLEELGVVEGRTVVEGQVVGTVGGTDTPEGAHLEFQIRAPLDGGPPEALDPLQWLRAPRGRDDL